MEDVTVEPDGSTTFEDAGSAGQEETFAGAGEDAGAGAEDAGEGFGEGAEEAFEEIVKKSMDPAIYLLIIVVLCLVGFVIYQRKKKEEEEDDFFSNLDGEKVRRNKNFEKESIHACLETVSFLLLLWEDRWWTQSLYTLSRDGDEVLSWCSLHAWNWHTDEY